jgi:hypothetical protein
MDVMAVSSAPTESPTTVGESVAAVTVWDDAKHCRANDRVGGDREGKIIGRCVADYYVQVHIEISTAYQQSI